MDAWIRDKPLQEFLTNQVPNTESNAKVNVFWDTRGGWKQELMNNIPDDIIRQIELKNLTVGEEEDEATWMPTASGKFSIDSAYNFIKGYEPNMQEPFWSKTWKLKVPSKMNIFLWTALHDRVLGNAERKRRGLTMDGCCSICPGKEETTEHILKTCKQAKEVWSAVAGREMCRRWNSLSSMDWLRHNITHQTRPEDGND